MELFEEAARRLPDMARTGVTGRIVQCRILEVLA
jgi:hypothetical protein